MSVWLRGGKQLQEHPMAGPYHKWIHKVFFEGEEKVGSIQCVKLRCEIHEPTPENKLNTRRFLWLSPEYNYLPVKTEGFAIAYSDRLPLEIGLADDFREVTNRCIKN